MTLLKLEMLVFVIQTNQLGFGSFGEVNGMGGKAFPLPSIASFLNMWVLDGQFAYWLHSCFYFASLVLIYNICCSQAKIRLGSVRRKARRWTLLSLCHLPPILELLLANFFQPHPPCAKHSRKHHLQIKN